MERVYKVFLIYLFPPLPLLAYLPASLTYAHTLESEHARTHTPTYMCVRKWVTLTSFLFGGLHNFYEIWMFVCLCVCVRIHVLYDVWWKDIIHHFFQAILLYEEGAVYSNSEKRRQERFIALHMVVWRLSINKQLITWLSLKWNAFSEFRMNSDISGQTSLAWV